MNPLNTDAKSKALFHEDIPAWARKSRTYLLWVEKDELVICACSLTSTRAYLSILFEAANIIAGSNMILNVLTPQNKVIKFLKSDIKILARVYNEAKLSLCCKSPCGMEGI